MRNLVARLTRWDQLLLLLAAAYLALWPFEDASRLIHGLRVLLQAAIYIVAAGVIVRLTVRAAAVVTRRFLWRVRHRMVIAYFLVGVLPLGLVLLAVTAGAALLFGPLAAYIVSAQLDQRAAALYATADSMAWELRAAPDDEARRRIGRRFIEDSRRRFPGLLARFETPDGPRSIPAGLAEQTPPEQLGAYRGLVRKDGELYLAAYPEFEAGSPSLLVMAPLSDAMLESLAPNVGVVRRAFPQELDGGRALAASDPPAGRRAAAQRIARFRESPGPAIQARLPPPEHPLDWAVPWEAQTRVLDWDTGETKLESPLVLITRPSAVFRVIFRNQTERMRSLSANLGRAIVIALGVIVLVSTIVAVSLTRTITGSIHDLYVATQHVDRGDFSYRAPVSGHSQLTELARSFNVMTTSIERLFEDSRQRQRLESELTIAHEVQEQLFPRNTPHLATLETLGVCRPAQSVSGDFYDYVQLSDDRVALSFGDVSGKGISAALVMAAVHSSVRTQLGLSRGLGDDGAAEASELVAETNRQLCAGTAPEKFATLFFGIYDQRDNRLYYVNAGHLPPILVRNGVAKPLEVTGMVVGAFPGQAYEARTLELEPGDLLAAFTDGVTEPENPYGVPFGEERLAEILIREADRPLEAVIRAVMDEVIAWTGAQPELTDDMTMLAARRSA